MFSNDQETHEALNTLITTVQNKDRPLVVWVGAGTSAWAGYPLWQEVAAAMHTTFSREEQAYDKKVASRLLKDEQYPELFEHMRFANQPRYFTILSQNFSPRRSTGVYSRLVQTLNQIAPAHIVTTNVDEVLEHSLPELEVVQRSDIERLPRLLNGHKAFICKLHGSVSSVESMVFSMRDYDSIQQDHRYLTILESMFSDATILFLGYGLRDEYVIRCMQASSAGRPLFGTGPHFIVTSNKTHELPSTVRLIRYVAETADHRSALLTLEAIRDVVTKPETQDFHVDIAPATAKQSLYFIGDLITPGTWTTSQTMTIEAKSGFDVRQMIVGQGYIDGEVELHNYSALHDIVVGLICFDVVCVSVDHLARVHDLLGSEAFWLLVKTDSFRVVIPPPEPALIFANEHELVGDLSAINLGAQSSSFETFSLMSNSERIRKHLLPAPGKEAEAEKLFELLESTILDVSKANLSEGLPEKTRGALMHPSIRRLLGVSAGTPRNAVPRWVAFPVLRLAEVIRRGLICQHIQACATRMIWGSEKLASAAFSATTGEEWADSAASYALTGRFNSDVGSIVEKDPALLLGILQFRETQVGENFRREIAQRLAVDSGSEIVTAINSGLSQAIPTSVLDQARDQLSGLFVPLDHIPRLIPAVWGDLRNSDERIANWRKRSRIMLNQLCADRRLGPYDACPCGSGEKLKFCCQAALG